MLATLAFDVLDALVTLGTNNLPDLNTYDGTGVSEDPGGYLQVGVEDPDVDGWQAAATSVIDWAHANNTAVNDEGTAMITIKRWNGGAKNADQKAARDAVRADLETLSTLIRQDPTLGLGPVLWSARISAVALDQIQDGNGSAARLRCQIAYKGQF